jgi:hypothetical protein
MSIRLDDYKGEPASHRIIKSEDVGGRMPMPAFLPHGSNFGRSRSGAIP